MCTNTRYLRNKYTGKSFVCNCGHCKSCLQDKAVARTSRIRSEFDDQHIVLFVTLTYDRISCPYICKSDVSLYRKRKDVYGHVYKSYGTRENILVPVYRHYTLRWDVNSQKYVRNWQRVKLTEVFVDELTSASLSGMKELAHRPYEYGVCFYKDYQDFMKRLRQNLIRQHNYYEKFKIFNVSEYGETSYRPHFHFLLYAKPGSFEIFRSAIIAAWPFGYRIREEKSIQLVTSDPAGYVSSYVNSGTDFPLFLAKYFKPKHSFSRYFGHGRKSFQLVSLEKKISSGDLSFDMLRNRKDGPEIVNLPIPKYVVNRFFPLFKGYSRLDGDKVRDYILSGFSPLKLWSLALRHDKVNYKFKISMTFDEALRISKHFLVTFDFCRSVLGKTFSLFDYSFLYQKAWNVFRSNMYKRLMLDDTVSNAYKYDNLFEFANAQELSLSLDPRARPCVNPNENPWRVSKTLKMTTMYDKYLKQKRVSNIAMRANGVYV